MSIFTMCDKAQAGQPNVTEHKGFGDEVYYMEETWKGLVISHFERNGYDDSDYYAVVWDPEKEEPREVEYATTRAWTYLNHVIVDAPPEIVAKYKAYQERRWREMEERRLQEELLMPRKGKTVRVVKGRKVPIGTVGCVFWQERARKFGWERYHEPRVLRAEHYRLGIKTADGETFFMNGGNVEVIAQEGEEVNYGQTA